MRRTVYNFSLPSRTNKSISIAVSVDSHVCAVEMQNGAPRIWIDFDAEARTYAIEFEVYETGDTVPGGRKHVGTIFDQDNTYVLHVFAVDSFGVLS
jgi:hypothetical protein